MKPNENRLAIDLSAPMRKEGGEIARRILQHINNNRNGSVVKGIGELFGEADSTMRNYFQKGIGRYNWPETMFDYFCAEVEGCSKLNIALKKRFDLWAQKVRKEFEQLRSNPSQPLINRRFQESNLASKSKYEKTGAYSAVSQLALSRAQLKMHFGNTRWVAYCRMTADGILGRRTFTFGEVNEEGECPVEIQHFHLDTLTPWIGTARYNIHDHVLFMDVSYDYIKSGVRAGFSSHMFAVHPSNTVLSMCIGHHTFINFKSTQIISIVQVIIPYDEKRHGVFQPGVIKLEEKADGEFKIVSEINLPEAGNNEILILFKYLTKDNKLIHTPNVSVYSLAKLESYLTNGEVFEVSD